MPFLLRLYQILTRLLRGGAGLYTHYRLKKGKEDPQRITERFGKASQERPQGAVIWFHGASVGETLSLLPILERIHQQFPDVSCLVTTGTRSAATVIAKKLPPKCIHQYIPWDVPGWVNRFLDHWHPNIAVFVESEFWPNLILGSRKHKIPLYLFNAHLSEQSFRSWKRVSSTIRYLLSCFELCLAQSATIAEYLVRLGTNPKKVRVSGNLKFAASPLPFDGSKLEALNIMIKDRPMWVTASTHEGEEKIAAEAHHHLKSKIPELLTIICPRHPERAESIAKDLTSLGLNVSRRSLGQPIEFTTDIYLADTLGELGLFYQLSTVAFLGGTFVPIGGHNPIEPMLLDCTLIWGPFTHTQTPICDVLQSAAFPVSTPEELTATVEFLLKNKTIREAKIQEARKLIETQAFVLEDVIQVLKGRLAA